MKVSPKEGFTLVEIMIVVAIIGLLSLLAIPYWMKARESAQNSRYAADLRVATGAFQEFAIVNGDYPADRQPGEMPDGMESYLAKMRWDRKNAIGGLWDWDHQVFGVNAGISAYQPDATAAQLTRLDKMIDDGNLQSGLFRHRSSGYIYVIE